MDAAAMDAAVVGKAMFVEAVGGGEVAEAVGGGAVEGAAVGERGEGDVYEDYIGGVLRPAGLKCTLSALWQCGSIYRKSSDVQSNYNGSVLHPTTQHERVKHDHVLVERDDAVGIYVGGCETFTDGLLAKGAEIA